METKKLEDLIEMIVKALVLRSKIVWIVVRITLGISIVMTLLVGIQVGRIIQLMLT